MTIIISILIVAAGIAILIGAAKLLSCPIDPDIHDPHRWGP